MEDWKIDDWKTGRVEIFFTGGLEIDEWKIGHLGLIVVEDWIFEIDCGGGLEDWKRDDWKLGD